MKRWKRCVLYHDSAESRSLKFDWTDGVLNHDCMTEPVPVWAKTARLLFMQFAFTIPCSLSWPVPLCYTLFSFYLFLFLSFLMLFFVSSLYHILFLSFIMLFFVSSFYSYVILCFFLLSPSLMLFFVFIILSLSLLLFFVSSFYSYVNLCFFTSITFFYVILCFKHILSLSLSVFPYVIFCFFLPSPSHSLFYYCDLFSKQQSTVGRKQFQKARAEVDLYFLGQTAVWCWARNELESALMKNRLNANRSDLVFCNGVLICDSCLWF